MVPAPTLPLHARVRIDPDLRRVELSVGELADFTTAGPGLGTGAAPLWRLEAGRLWHAHLREEHAADPSQRFEVTVGGPLRVHGWDVALTGRIDQLALEPGLVRIIEIKTVTVKLPLAADALRRTFPHHLVQTAAYLELARHGGLVPPPPPNSRLLAELVLVETESGLRQRITLGEEHTLVLRERLAELVAFCEARRTGLARLRGLTVRPAFEEPRPGQETAVAEVADALAAARIVLLEAPTGFGKTGTVLECALRRLQSGAATRLVFATGKSTGQWPVVEQLARMQDGDGARVWQMRPKREHCINTEYLCHPARCHHLDGCAARLHATTLWRHDNPDTVGLDALRAAGAAAEVCPFEITRAALPFRDVWICDYNYLFAPRQSHLFTRVPGFDPAQTLLVVDEAHNLPARAADALSVTVTLPAVRAAAAVLDWIGASAGLRAAWERLARLLGARSPVEELGPEDEDELARVLERVAVETTRQRPEFEELGADAGETLDAALNLRRRLDGDRSRHLLWSRHAGEVSLTCLDAAPEIAAVLGGFESVVLQSATFGPLGAFAASCGLPESAALPAEGRGPWTGVRLDAPWRIGAVRVAVDTRGDTTLRARERTAPVLASAVGRLRGASDGPVAVFLPSFAYAGLVEHTLAAHQPHLRCALQPRGADLGAREAFLRDALEAADVLLLVLGGAFAEGIDLLGGRVTHAVVAGPALPELNAVQRARERALAHLGRGVAFRRVYDIPGMLKVNQAIGRLVRAPGQRAHVLLFCRRFATDAYALLLDRDYQQFDTVAADGDLAAWLGDRPG